MAALFDVRVLLSNVLFSVFGYLTPSLNSVKAVVTEDIDGIREYMTYWVVLSISTFIGTILQAMNFFKHYSPEMKVLFVMWLTLPRFQGAYRIYTLFLRFYFAMYEDEIDQKVDEISVKIRSKLWHKLKAVCWILFISSNDALLSSGGGSLNNVNIALEAFRVLQGQWESFTGNGVKEYCSNGSVISKHEGNAALACDSDKGTSEAVGGSDQSLKPSAAQLLRSRKQLLAEFIDMIEAGFCFYVACVAGHESAIPGPDRHIECRLYLVQTQGGHSGIIHVEAVNSSRFSLDESVDLMMQAEEMEERTIDGFVSFAEDTKQIESASFSLDKIVGVDEDDDKEDGGLDAGVILELKMKEETYLMSIRTEDQENRGALTLGLQMLVERERARLRRRPLRNR